MRQNILDGPAPEAQRQPSWFASAYRRLRWRYFPPKSGLVTFAERELARIGDPDGDEMQSDMNRHILRMVRTFAREGHSGFSAGYAVHILQKLLRYEPLGPLTGEDSEWNNVSDMAGEEMWQNNRCPHVFKDADGRAYDINARVFVEPSGAAFTGQGSRAYVTFPYTPSRVEILVNDEGEPLEGPSRDVLASQ